jgi:histone arginine demethylase JMJD6
MSDSQDWAPSSAQWAEVAASTPASARHSAKVADRARVRERGDLKSLDAWERQRHFESAHALLVGGGAGAGNEGAPLARADARELTPVLFRERFEATRTPCVLEHAADEWPAVAAGRWGIGALYARHRHARLKVGEDDDGGTVRVKLKHFLRYMAPGGQGSRDDSPLYVFDSLCLTQHAVAAAAAAVAVATAPGGAEAPAATPAAAAPPKRGIAADYCVPHVFDEDLFALVGERRRPPYQWFLIGPKRSGTTVHIDPLGTSAWNTLIAGKKRWVLVPPDVPRATALASDLVKRGGDAGEDDEAIDYFTRVLPRLKERQGAAFAARIIEYTQLPGETMFVPGGWSHAVLNIENSVAVTHNYCSSGNFERVWLEVRKGRRGMARKWLRQLRVARPDLAAQADAINARSGWTPEAAAARHRKRIADRAAALQMRRERKRRGEPVSESDSSESNSDSSSGSETPESSADESAGQDEVGGCKAACEPAGAGAGAVASAGAIASAGAVASAGAQITNADAAPTASRPPPASSPPPAPASDESSSEEEGVAARAAAAVRAAAQRRLAQKRSSMAKPPKPRGPKPASMMR